jgi:hypothetical protein
MSLVGCGKSRPFLFYLLARDLLSLYALSIGLVLRALADTRPIDSRFLGKLASRQETVFLAIEPTKLKTQSSLLLQ